MMVNSERLAGERAGDGGSHHAEPRPGLTPRPRHARLWLVSVAERGPSLPVARDPRGWAQGGGRALARLQLAVRRRGDGRR